MFRQWAVAGLAVNGLMNAARLHGSFIGVTRLAGLVPCKRHGPRTNLCQGIPTKRAVSAIAFRNSRRTEDKKKDQTEQEDCRQPNQMRRVFEFSHAGAP